MKVLSVAPWVCQDKSEAGALAYGQDKQLRPKVRKSTIVPGSCLTL